METNDKLLHNLLKLVEPTEQVCQVCGNVYTGTRIRLCEEKNCRQFFAMEKNRNAYKYGPSFSNPKGTDVFFWDYTYMEREKNGY